MPVILAISNRGFMMGGGEFSYVDLLTRLPASLKPLAVVPEEGELSDRLRIKGVDSEVLYFPPIRPWQLVNLIICISRLTKILKIYRPALIYANGSRAAIYGGLAGRILGIPVVWHCRITEPDHYLDLLLAKLCTRIIVNSKATADRFPRHIKPKIKIVYNGVNISWFRDGTVQSPDKVEEGWKIILSVARVTKSKRHDILLSAFETIAESNTNAHLVCIGSFDQSDQVWIKKLMEKTRHSEFFDRIHWIGPVEDVRPWYKVAALMVLPAEKEAFGRVLVEAMACRLPVIASRSGGIPEIIRHGKDGWLVSPGNYSELADAIVKMLKDDSLKKRIVLSAEQRSRMFDLETHLKKMVVVFNELVTKETPISD